MVKLFKYSTIKYDILLGRLNSYTGSTMGPLSYVSYDITKENYDMYWEDILAACKYDIANVRVTDHPILRNSLRLVLTVRRDWVC